VTSPKQTEKKKSFCGLLLIKSFHLNFTFSEQMNENNNSSDEAKKCHHADHQEMINTNCCDMNAFLANYDVNVHFLPPCL
jgi:hypothetical protein